MCFLVKVTTVQLYYFAMNQSLFENSDCKSTLEKPWQDLLTSLPFVVGLKDKWKLLAGIRMLLLLYFGQLLPELTFAWCR